MRVVNIHQEPCTHYCGRASSFYKAPDSIDFSILGNPFDMQKLGITRSECLKLYEEYLWSRYDNVEPELFNTLKQFHEYDGVVLLGCFCKPKSCHCDTIVEVYEQFKWDQILYP